MAPEKAPAFQFYPKDFLADGNVRSMSLAERGAYITLLSICWIEQSLWMDIGRLANQVGIPRRQMAKMWPSLAPCFRPHPSAPERLIHPRLELERQKQDVYRHRQSEAAKGRWTPQPSGNQGHTTAMPPHVSGISHADAGAMPDGCSPLSDLLSPVSTLRVSQSARSLAPPEVGERAGRLVERYQELFYRERQGARYRPRPNLDWTDALELCAIWDDARLEKLAVLVLTTDDPFISSTDRSFKIFAMKASWADDRLKQWEIANQVRV